MEIDRLDLNLLKTFDAIHRHNNLSAAAVELGLTQPAVSAALKRLRSHFDNPLFVRTSHGMRPTPHADAMAGRIARALSLLREMGQLANFSRSTTTVHYRIYINDVGMLVVMPQVLKQVSDHAPHAKLSIIDLRPDEVVDALDAGEIDLAIGHFEIKQYWHERHHAEPAFQWLRSVVRKETLHMVRQRPRNAA